MRTTQARRRRNPGGEFMVVNPRRRRRRAPRARHRARRRNPYFPVMNRNRRGRRRRRNPGLFGAGRGGNLFGIPLGQAFTIALGAVGSDIVGGLVSRFVPIPGLQGTPTGKFVAKGAAVVLGSMLARGIVGKKMGNAFALGGAVSLLLDGYNQFVKPMLPAGMLGEYVTESMGMGTYEPEYSLGALTNDGGARQWASVLG